MALNSPLWPLLGIVLVWTFYVCFLLFREPTFVGPADVREPSLASRAPAAEPKTERSPLTSPRSIVDGKEAEDAADEAETATPAEVLAEPDHKFELNPEDAELLAIFSGSFGPEELERLEAFVAAHPEHALARGLLITHLLREEADDAVIRPHVQALQALLPEMGLPDLFMAQLEMLAGRDAYARTLLLGAVEKDLTWFPESELFWMGISSKLASGENPTKVMAGAFSMGVPLCSVARQLANQFLPRKEPSDEADGSSRSAELDAQTRSETARAILRFGDAMQEHGLVMVENLVGGALVLQSSAELERAGGLSAEDRAIVRRTKAIQRDARLLSNLTEEVLFSNPDAMSSYVVNLLQYGELRAARRGIMDYLATR